MRFLLLFALLLVSLTPPIESTSSTSAASTTTSPTFDEEDEQTLFEMLTRHMQPPLSKTSVARFSAGECAFYLTRAKTQARAYKTVLDALQAQMDALRLDLASKDEAYNARKRTFDALDAIAREKEGDYSNIGATKEKTQADLEKFTEDFKRKRGPKENFKLAKEALKKHVEEIQVKKDGIKNRAAALAALTDTKDAVYGFDDRIKALRTPGQPESAQHRQQRLDLEAKIKALIGDKDVGKYRKDCDALVKAVDIDNKQTSKDELTNFINDRSFNDNFEDAKKVYYPEIARIRVLTSIMNEINQREADGAPEGSKASRAEANVAKVEMDKADREATTVRTGDIRKVEAKMRKLEQTYKLRTFQADLLQKIYDKKNLQPHRWMFLLTNRIDKVITSSYCVAGVIIGPVLLLTILHIMALPPFGSGSLKARFFPKKPIKFKWWYHIDYEPWRLWKYAKIKLSKKVVVDYRIHNPEDEVFGPGGEETPHKPQIVEYYPNGRSEDKARPPWPEVPMRSQIAEHSHMHGKHVKSHLKRYEHKPKLGKRIPPPQPSSDQPESGKKQKKHAKIPDVAGGGGGSDPPSSDPAHPGEQPTKGKNEDKTQAGTEAPIQMMRDEDKTQMTGTVEAPIVDELMMITPVKPKTVSLVAKPFKFEEDKTQAGTMIDHGDGKSENKSNKSDKTQASAEPAEATKASLPRDEKKAVTRASLGR